MRNAATAALLTILTTAGCSSSASFGDPIDGVECTPKGRQLQIQTHTHTMVILVDSGEELPIATSNIGIGGECTYWVRTESEPGVVHVEAPIAIAPTLDTFLKVWERSGFPPGDIAGPDPWRRAADRGRIEVDGAAVAGGAKAVTLRDGSIIRLIAPTT